MSYKQSAQIRELIDSAQKIVIMQADNPDGDSLGSALALEQLLGELGKDTYLYCAVDMPTYMHYVSGWDRVTSELPKTFDLSIIVDASTISLFEKLAKSGQQGWVATKPCVVIDHHGETAHDIPFVTVTLNDPGSSSTGEVIYKLAEQLQWKIDATAGSFIMSSILGDTQGLTNDLTRADTYRIMADLVDLGVSRPKLEEQRREYSKMDPIIFKYKARLLERTAFHADGKIALVTVPQSEINTYSPLYNPAPLIQNDMLQTVGVGVAIVLKHYDDGKILCAIKCNPGAGIGAELAKSFGGGGHPYASGFKITDGRPVDEITAACIRIATELLAKLETGNNDETLQHSLTTD